MLYVSYIIFYIIIILYSYLFYPVAEPSLVSSTIPSIINTEIREIPFINAEIPNNINQSFFKQHQKKIIIGSFCLLVIGVLFFYREDLIKMTLKKNDNIENTLDNTITDSLDTTIDIVSDITSQGSNTDNLSIYNPIYDSDPVLNPGDINIAMELTCTKAPPIYCLIPNNLGSLDIMPYTTSSQIYDRCTESLLTAAINKTIELRALCDNNLPFVLNLYDMYIPKCLDISTWSNTIFLNVLHHEHAIITLLNSKVHLFTITKALFYMLDHKEKHIIIDAYKYLFY